MWLSPEEVATLWAEVVAGDGIVCSRGMSGETVRRYCREGLFERAGISVLVKPMRYYVERESLLRYVVECCDGVRERAERELARE